MSDRAPIARAIDRRRLFRATICPLTLLAVSLPSPSAAHDRESGPEEEPRADVTITVEGRADDMTGVATSAAEGVTGARDLAARPLVRPGELLETAPGMIATQHSGGGKANQYFLRGFNLDHGTDFRVDVDGMPVNMPTHGHGQGYADVNFVIPELIETVTYRKGNYDARTGDFSAAGSAGLRLAQSLDGPLLTLTGGDLGHRRAVAGGSLPLASGTLTGAFELARHDGPWQRPSDFDKLNLLARWLRPLGDSSLLDLSFLAYDGSWDSTDQIPLRAVESGLIDRFGTLDDDLGGSSARYSLSGAFQRTTGESITRGRASLIHYDLDLLSNFTYFLDDPELGDQFRQRDDRTIVRVDGEHERFTTWRGRSLRWLVGGEVRHDAIGNGLYRSSGGVDTGTVREDEVGQWLVAGHASAEIRWTPAFRTTLGMRADHIAVDVASDLAANSGNGSDLMLSPKLSAAFGPFGGTELYVNAGTGFHSNDARGVTIRVDPTTGEEVDPVDALVRAKSVDLGLRTTLVPGLNSTVSLFYLELDSELVFVGDAGGTEAGRPSRRRGIELANFYRPFDWLSVDLDVTLSDGRFRDDDPAGDHIPGAMETTVAAGIALAQRQGAFGSLRWRYFGDRPLTEDDSVRAAATSLVNARVGYGFRNGLALSLEVFNLLDREDSDIEYFYASRLPGEAPGGVEDIHFHPVEPRAFRALATWRF